ncbi:PfkB family carbohydrate kinase [Saxibacter everestensis]|uniref:PfkB family carbohydrate kinase n=1 Tax=Saxibacter everestensis TaxID=2909229 RepID=A0ABY8QR63_9MICO|nr:PfkB family carbohydrate kinase [Brevibacteriaceae bacterium ZFBP1038]
MDVSSPESRNPTGVDHGSSVASRRGEVSPGNAATSRPSDATSTAYPGEAYDETYDVFLAGSLFMDLVFAGLPHAPVLGTETWADAMGCCPGGVANMAVATSRLGARTSLATIFGDDFYGDFCHESLEVGESIDLSGSIRKYRAHTPVTVSLSYDGDRTMISHGHVSKVGVANPEAIPQSKAFFASIESGMSVPWLAQARSSGAKVFADTGWDSSEKWDLTNLTDLAYVDVFMPNAAEAMAFTKTDNALDAARRLSDHVELAVVTQGKDGAIAVDGGTGDIVQVQGIDVQSVDPTGAGDIFAAGVMVGLISELDVRSAVTLGTVAAGLSVQWMGGSFSAPSIFEVGDWYQRHQAKGSVGFETAYGFIPDLVPDLRSRRRPRRAIPTVGFRQ